MAYADPDMLLFIYEKFSRITEKCMFMPGHETMVFCALQKFGLRSGLRMGWFIYVSRIPII